MAQIPSLRQVVLSRQRACCEGSRAEIPASTSFQFHPKGILGLPFNSHEPAEILAVSWRDLGKFLNWSKVTLR